MQQQESHISMSASSHSFSMLKTRRRNDSGELDVFDATLYFSGRVDDDVNHRRIDRRRSLDASLGAMLIHEDPQKVENGAVQFKGTKKSRQSSSPRGMLASFLNSLFHQTTSKKKSKSGTTTSSLPKDDECKEKRDKGKRRSSIALHEKIDDSIISEDRQWRCSLNNTNGHKNLKDPFCSERSEARAMNRSPFHNGPNRWLLHGSSINNMVYHKDPLWAEVFIRKEEYCLGKREEGEDGGDQRSESSSDLFELKNCDIGVGHLSSSGLPVYETAELHALKRGTAVAF